MKNRKEAESVYTPALRVLLAGFSVLTLVVWGMIGIVLQWEF